MGGYPCCCSRFATCRDLQDYWEANYSNVEVVLPGLSTTNGCTTGDCDEMNGTFVAAFSGHSVGSVRYDYIFPSSWLVCDGNTYTKFTVYVTCAGAGPGVRVQLGLLPGPWRYTNSTPLILSSEGNLPAAADLHGCKPSGDGTYRFY